VLLVPVLEETGMNTLLIIYLILKSYPKYTIDRDIAGNADKNRKTSKKHTGHM